MRIIIVSASWIVNTYKALEQYLGNNKHLVNVYCFVAASSLPCLHFYFLSLSNICEIQFCLNQCYYLEKAMAPHSSTLAWRIPWTEEPGRLQSMGSQRVGHDWANSLSLFTFMLWRRKWQPTPVFCLENPRDGGAWWAAVYGVAQSRTRLKRRSSSSSIKWESAYRAVPHSSCALYGGFHALPFQHN